MRSSGSSSRLQTHIREGRAVLRLPALVTGIVFCLLAPGLIVSGVCAEIPAGGVHVFDNIYMSGLHSISVSEMLYLLDIAPGKEITPPRVRSGIKRAFLKEIFDDILFERAEDGRLDIVVKERKIIHSVEIGGLERLSERSVTKLLGVMPGTRITLPAIEKKLVDLKEKLRLRGFPGAEIAYRILPHDVNRVILRAEVKEGDPEVIRKVIVTNSGIEMPLALPLSEGDVLDRTELDAFKAKLIARMKKEHHVKSRIEYSFSEGSLHVSFDSGRRVVVEFLGNSALSEGKLMRDVTFYEIDDMSDELIEETMSRVMSRYHEAGYPFARIVPAVSESDEEMVITFFVYEGNKHVVESVSFSGATLSAQRLQDVLLLRKGSNYNPDEIDSDRESLVDLYQSLGFISAKIGQPVVRVDEQRVSIAYQIDEGQQVLIDSIAIRNIAAIPEDELKAVLKVKKGSPYNAVDLLDSSRRIKEIYQQRGYQNVSVSLSREVEGTRANIQFDVSEGKKILFGKRVIVGNERTREKVISREIIHKDGDPFSFARIYDERIKLYKTGLFDDIEIVTIDGEATEKDVIYRFSESPAGEFEFGFGYGNFEKIRGFLNVRYNNLWGLNRRVSIRTELSDLNSRAIIAYDEPWFFDRELPLKVLLLAEKRKELNYDTNEVLYRLDRFMASVGTEKNLSARVKGELFYSGSITETYDVQPDVVLSRQDVGTLFISSIRAGLTYDSRNNTFTPSRGVLAGLSLEVASSLLFSQTDYAKLSMNVNLYQGITEWLVGALSLRGGLAFGYRETDELPIVKRFFLGGRTTVRGYKEDTLGPKGADGNPTGGNAFLMGNFELRSNIWKGLGAVAFLDAGNVWQKVTEIDIAQVRFTTGLGLRYNTPVGPVSVDYGIKLSRIEGESKGVLYFTIGNAF